MHDVSDKPTLTTAKAILSQIFRDTPAARGSVWGYLLLTVLIFFSVGLVIYFASYPLLTGAPEQVSYKRTAICSIYAFLALPFLAGASWACIQSLRRKPVRAWPAFKYICSRYLSLLGYLAVMAIFLVCFKIGFGKFSPIGSVLLTVLFVYVVPLMLEQKISVFKAIHRSWVCVRQHRQFWLLIRAYVLLMLYILAVLIVPVLLLRLLAHLIHAAVLFKFLELGLLIAIGVYLWPYALMFQNTLYCRFFHENGDMVVADVKKDASS